MAKLKPVPEDSAAEQGFQTPAINKMLFNKYTELGQHVLLFDVPDHVGGGRRRCDAIAIGMWNSSGRHIHGFEVKASRSDWLRELKDVSKADPFISRCDKWWLVTGHISIAKPEEIPECWGWMVATKTGLRIHRVPATLPQDSDRLQRAWAFALIRVAADARGDVNSTEFQIRVAAAAQEASERERRRADAAIASIHPDYEKLRAKVDRFEKDSGMKMEDWRLGNVGNLARRIATLNNHGYAGVKKTLERMIEGANEISKNAAAVIEGLDQPALTDSDKEREL